MFEVNGIYANRKGEYQVLEINPPKMRVRFIADGSEANLRIELQARIWENIIVERASQADSQPSQISKSLAASSVNHYIKVISVPVVDEMSFSGWLERVVMASLSGEGNKLNEDDRLIFYALETKTFFAVATLVGESITANPKEYFFTVHAETAQFFAFDIDATSGKLGNGADIDAVELESHPNFKQLRLEAEAFLRINEDDFELLADALVEAVEDAEEEDDTDDEEPFEED
ncbi:hypothetical protein MNBD_CHLOROFLEXI01-5337 [hydrothermal vent metagenome]|uniref:Uncharacterized protein n=1 Tax=hydrothermal vent metagenome TaxID=652676 RepID=A0A3B0VW97_9ZZZZ